MKQIFLALLFIYIPSSVLAQWYNDARAIMGTSVTVELWDDNEQHAKQCIAQVMAVMNHVNETMSPYLADSELSRINRDAASKPVKIHRELFDLIKYSLYFSDISAGAFDITFASVGYRYDYRQNIRPSDADIARDLDKINYHHIELDDKALTIRFRKVGVRIDLGGIAKGHAVDQSIKKLQHCGIKQAMVSAGGDSRIIGDRQGRPWITGVRDPRNANASAVLIPLTDTAISTSGDYERYFIENGERFHHILNPRTGKSASAIRSATVLGPNATLTDGLSTTVFVLGLQKGMALIDTLTGVDAMIIDNEGRLYYSKGLTPPEKPPVVGEKPGVTESTPN